MVELANVSELVGCDRLDVVAVGVRTDRPLLGGAEADVRLDRIALVVVPRGSAGERAAATLDVVQAAPVDDVGSVLLGLELRAALVVRLGFRVVGEIAPVDVVRPLRIRRAERLDDLVGSEAAGGLADPPFVGLLPGARADGGVLVVVATDVGPSAVVFAGNCASEANRSVPERRKKRSSSTCRSRSTSACANLEPSARSSLQRRKPPARARTVALPPRGMAKWGSPLAGGGSRRSQAGTAAEVEATAPCAASPDGAGPTLIAAATTITATTVETYLSDICPQTGGCGVSSITNQL